MQHSAVPRLAVDVVIDAEEGPCTLAATGGGVQLPSGASVDDACGVPSVPTRAALAGAPNVTLAEGMTHTEEWLRGEHMAKYLARRQFDPARLVGPVGTNGENVVSRVNR